MGPGARVLPAASTEAWAHFVFAAQPAPGRAITVRWYHPNGRLLGIASKANRPVVTSFLRSRGDFRERARHVNLIESLWLCWIAFH